MLPGRCSIDTFAMRIGAKLHEYVESGLGNARWFGFESDQRWCACFVQYYVETGTHGPALQIGFESGVPNREHMDAVLAFFEISKADLSWLYR